MQASNVTKIWIGTRVRRHLRGETSRSDLDLDCSCACADFYEEKIAKLGPDPLREDADPELLWARMQRSKSPVGLILMQQDAVAGIGNIYRAEILFKVRTDAFLGNSPPCHACFSLGRVHETQLRGLAWAAMVHGGLHAHQ